MLSRITTNTITLESDWPFVTQVPERFQKGKNVKRTLAQRLNVPAPAWLVVILIGTIWHHASLCRKEKTVGHSGLRPKRPAQQPEPVQGTPG